MTRSYFVLARIPVNDYRARASYYYIATGVWLDASHYRELNQVEVPEDIGDYIQDHRSAIHADPAALEELETRDTEENDDEENDDDLPVISDREDDLEESEEEGEEHVEEAWEEFKRIQESFEKKMKSFLHDKNFRKSFIK